MEAPNRPGVYHIEMYRDYIDETIKLNSLEYSLLLNQVPIENMSIWLILV